jgi:hypothetical protein
MKTYYVLGASASEEDSEEDSEFRLITLHHTNDKNIAFNFSKEHTKKTGKKTYIVELIAITEMQPDVKYISDNDY